MNSIDRHEFMKQSLRMSTFAALGTISLLRRMNLKKIGL